MRKMILAAAVIPFLLAGCGRDTPDTIADEVNSIRRDLVAALEGVTDEASANAAAAKIDALTARLAPLKDRADKVRATAEGKAAFEARLKAAEKDLGNPAEKMMKIAMSNRKAAEIIAKALQRFGETAEKLK